MVCLMSTWLMLNLLDMITTYQALSTGNAAEMNLIMSPLLGVPLLLVSAKMALAFAAVKVVEKMSLRSGTWSIVSLVVLNCYIALACLNNACIHMNS